MTIYTAGAMLRQIDLDEIERERKRKERQREIELEAERKRADKAAKEKLMRRIEELTAMAKKNMEEEMEERRIKKQTLAPLPAVNDRRADVDVAKYEFTHSNCSKYLTDDVTAKSFQEDKYAAKFIRDCEVNETTFNAKYYPRILAADSLWAYVHEQMESAVLNPKRIIFELIVALGMPAALVQQQNADNYNYRFIKYYFREFRREWCKIREISYKDQSAEDNLWSYFKCWFCDKRLGPMIHYRAQLIDNEFEFASKPAERSNKEPNYPMVHFEVVEKDLIKLYKYQKALSKKIAAKKKHSKSKGKNSTAGHKHNKHNDDEKDEYKEAIDYNDSCKAGVANKDNNRDEVASDNDEDEDIKQVSEKSTAGKLSWIEDNDKLKERKAGDNYYEMTDEPKQKAKVKDNDIINDGKNVKAGAKQDDNIDQYDYSEAEEEEEEEEEAEKAKMNDKAVLE